MISEKEGTVAFRHAFLLDNFQEVSLLDRKEEQSPSYKKDRANGCSSMDERKLARILCLGSRKITLVVEETKKEDVVSFVLSLRLHVCISRELSITAAIQDSFLTISFGYKKQCVPIDD